VTGAGKSSNSNTFDVDPGALDHFTFSEISSPQVAGSAFSVTITAEDAYENTVTSHTVAAALTVNSGAGTWTPLTTTGGFTGGVWTGDVTISQSQSDVQITATGGGKNGTSNQFNVNPGALDHFAIA
jgi:hypothetical protein